MRQITMNRRNRRKIAKVISNPKQVESIFQGTMQRQRAQAKAQIELNKKKRNFLKGRIFAVSLLLFIVSLIFFC